MGKKVKPTSLLETAQEAVEEQKHTDENEVFEDQSIVGNGPMTADAKAKLEKYDALEKSVADLAREKEMLEAKVAEYAEKLASLEDADKTIKKLEKENAKLKKSSGSSKDAEKLIRENKALRDEADGYLVKISELTFENANLTCQLNEITKNSGNVKNQKHLAPGGRGANGQLRHPNEDAYNPYKNNGYGTWN